jgi:hypothetical protein
VRPARHYDHLIFKRFHVGKYTSVNAQITIFSISKDQNRPKRTSNFKKCTNFPQKKYIPKVHPTGEKMSNPYSRQNTLSITIQPLHTFIMTPMMVLGNPAHRTSKSDR